MKLLMCIFLTAFLVVSCKGDRILAIMPTPSYSHQIVFNPLWPALNSRGHHITLFTTDPIKNTNLSNFRQIDWSFAYNLWHEKHKVSEIIQDFNTNLVKCLNRYVDMMEDIFIQELEHPEVQQILKDENEHFDLVIVEFLNPVMIAFSKKFNCPFIGISPMDITNFVHEALDNPVSPALFPDFISPYDSDMNFIERIINTLYYFGNKLYFKYYFFPRMDIIAQRYFGKDMPKLEEMQRNASMVFLNINPITHNIRPLMRNILMIGGGTHVESNLSLAPDIQSFLDDAKNGAIYFSLGTNVKGTDLSETTKTTFLETFSELPYRVLWKFEDRILTNANIVVKSWLPQQQILKHPNLKVFITQGGLQSLEEAIYNGIPIIGMPVYLDQYSNIKRVVRKGMGIELDVNSIEKNALKSAIVEIINNPKYKSSAVKLSELLKDQPVSGIDQAVWWTEYVLKYKGAKYLKHSPILLYQYLLLDVIALLLLIVSIFTVSFLWMVKFLVYKRKCRGQKVLKLE